MLLIQRVITDLHESKQLIEHAVLSTQTVEDFSSYKFLIGKLNGLDIAINICKEILGNINHDNR